MKTIHAETLAKIYAYYSEKNYQALLENCSEQFTFQISGKSKLAGKYTRSNFETVLMQNIQSISHGTYQLHVHDILASDVHGTVLGTIEIQVNGKKVELRTVHVWRFENGKPVAGYEYPRDLYAYDEAWNALSGT